jgi:hypothetical protein
VVVFSEKCQNCPDKLVEPEKGVRPPVAVVPTPKPVVADPGTPDGEVARRLVPMPLLVDPVVTEVVVGVASFSY